MNPGSISWLSRPIRSRYILLVAVFFLGSGAYGFDADDPDYIGIDQIVPGSTGYCLTVFQDTKIEKFGIKVVSIIRNFEPGRDVILVMGTDERFEKIGPVRGCSGSPVYIDGRMAGALSGGWSFSKDPLYTVTPIEDILRISLGDASAERSPGSSAVSYDFSKPIDLAEFNEQFRAASVEKNESNNSLLPLVTSLPQHSYKELAELFGSMGFTPVAGTVAGRASVGTDIEPGGVLTVPIVYGDISVAAVGTAIDVRGDKVYGFGHSFPNLGYGPTDLPMAVGTVHTVVSSSMFSFKLASPGDIIGAIRSNDSAGVLGVIGQEAKTIPVHITVYRPDSSQVIQTRTFDCRIVSHRAYSPMAVQAVVVGAATAAGSLTPEHTIKYKARIDIAGAEPIIFENISSGRSFGELLDDTAGVVALLMNNPFEQADITSMDFEVRIEPKNIRAKIWALQLSDDVVKASETVDVSVILQTYRSEKELHKFRFDIPSDLKPGKYKLVIAGASEYIRFIKDLSPHRFTALDFPTLADSVKNLLAVRRSRLYLTMKIPSGGVTIRNKELPFLPQTKALLMQDKKRTTSVMPYNQWLEKSSEVGRIVLGKKTVRITVVE